MSETTGTDANTCPICEHLLELHCGDGRHCDECKDWGGPCEP